MSKKFLIIDNLGPEFYVYVESKKHFKKMAKSRGKPLSNKLLDNECNLSLLPNGHFVFKIK